MTFYELLDQVLELLQREGKVSYRALKREFNLDEEFLEDLKTEIIEVKQVAREEQGAMLVWTGNSGTFSTPGSAQDPGLFSSQSFRFLSPSSAITRPPHPPLLELGASPASNIKPEAERRQVTVMFCDLVGSTELSAQLDPEEFRDVLRDYQEICAKIIHRFEGHLAKYLGDGLLVYFGYPLAHEDDVQRAVRAGLGIIEAVEAYNRARQREKGLKISLRIGIHTGLVVAGEMGGGGTREPLAIVGETPNIAARLQHLAQPNMIVVSAATYRLIEGYFECQTLGAHPLRGFSQPLEVYRVLQEREWPGRLELDGVTGLVPLVGREQEIGLLVDHWEQAKNGAGQAVLLSGEAGIGKSRLVQVIKEQVKSEAHFHLESRCSPYYQHSAFYPIIALLQRLLQLHTDDTPFQKLAKLEQGLARYALPLSEVVPLLAPLLSIPLTEHYASSSLSPQRHKQKTIDALLLVLLGIATHRPLLIVMEDLHWSDSSTLEVLGLLIERKHTARIFILLTARPTFHPPWAPQSFTCLTPPRLTRGQIRIMVKRITEGKTLPAEVLRQLVTKTDGIPLFVEELTKMVLESDLLRREGDRYVLQGSLPSLAIPTTLHDSLMARLDRLASAKIIAQLGATLGREFSYALLQAVSPLDEETLQRELTRLVDLELLYQWGVPPQATYLFKHALIQEAAYQSLLKSTRQHYHRQIALVLTERFPEIVETQPELLAHHYKEGGLSEKAITCWQRASQRAIQRSDHAEAGGHLIRGLEVLATLPDTPERLRQELVLQMALGQTLMEMKGYNAPEVEQAYNRARMLYQLVVSG